jgi:hypothetical protein
MVYFPNGRRDGNTNSLKDPAACIPAFRSQGSGFPVIFDDYPLEALFHLPESFVLSCSLPGWYISIGLEHPFPIEPGIKCYPVLINGNAIMLHFDIPCCRPVLRDLF